MTDDEWGDYWPPEPPAPPTERDGIKVGDKIIITGLSGTEWSAEVIGFNSLENDIVVRWMDVHPGLDQENTISRSHVKAVRVVGRVS